MKHLTSIHFEDVAPILFEGVIQTNHMGIIRSVNKSVLDFFPKLLVSDLIGKQIQDMIPSKDIQLFYNHRQDMRNISLTIGMYHVMGNFHFYDKNHAFIILKNISNVHQLTVELGAAQRQIRQFHNILDYVEEGICFIDSNQKIVFYNKKMGELDAREPSSMRGEQYSKAFPEASYTNDPLLSALVTEREIIENESFISRSGKKYDIQQSNRPLFLGSQKTGALCAVKDVSKLSELGQTIHQLHLVQEGQTAAPSLPCNEQAVEYIHSTRGMKKILQDAIRTINSSGNILIYGERGVGKKQLARYITQQKSPSFCISCDSLPPHFIEKSLFGTVDSVGLLEKAHGGTIILQNVNALDISIQNKLLHLIHNKRLFKELEETEVPIDVQFICTMNIKPAIAFKEQILLENFFYAISGTAFHIPPLRERKQEIPLLIEHFIHKKQSPFSANAVSVSKEAMELFINYHYPANVRQLEYLIEGVLAVLHNETVIMTEHLPDYLLTSLHDETTATHFAEDEFSSHMNLTDRVESFEKELILKTLQKTNFHITNASELLGITRQSLNYKIRKYEIENTRSDL
ncbi:arginine utilization regulatory protein RocR [Sporosarcina sp. NCCP-2222]|uniref:sigma 54-interacting transcriptional regulator n=1 Tax=Sporosarcina sp. NCCP-2222 TaxID=2935073 RepID=UPI0020884140|nr:sigma 54-interacting transcriptional regulator [Sporosarcina sp. NCCP-2222]GKV57275.1 arginine utilization regulatory protein RocR [Sporosarcina sp. NCCP-2222]